MDFDVYRLSEGDTAKIMIIENMKEAEVQQYLYMKRVRDLNFKYEMIAEKKRLEKLKNK